MLETVKTVRKVTKKDWKLLADTIIEEYKGRKQRRRDKEELWDEVDRQVAQKPSHKFRAFLKDQKATWIPELELPWQSYTLEVLTADINRLIFPAEGKWFDAASNVPEELFRQLESKNLIAGTDKKVPSTITQDNVDKIVEGVLDNNHKQYRLQSMVGRIAAESLKYSMGVGRVRNVSRSIFMNSRRQVSRKDVKIPVLLPRSIRNTYLDDSKHHMMNEGMVIDRGVIFCSFHKLVDLFLAASKGSTDPNSEDGGWMPAQLKNLEADNTGHVELLEYEGDIILPRSSTGSIYIPNVIVTVVKDGKTKDEHRVIRFRFRELPFNTYLEFPYHMEGAEDLYGSSPLVKGMPVQSAASIAFAFMSATGALKALPPTSYDRDDRYLASKGGPAMIPGAQWPSTGRVEVYNNIGNLSEMAAVYSALYQQYQDITGVNAPRLGQQTVSHTTAFAKQAELNRGTVRTVDFVQDVLSGPLTTFLHYEYEILRRNMKPDTLIYQRDYKGYLEISKEDLPVEVTFTAHGANGPLEQQQKVQQRMQGIQLALALEPMKVQTGGAPLDYQTLQEEILRMSGMVDLDGFFTQVAAGQGAPAEGGQAVSGAPQSSPGAVIAGIQAVTRRQ
jgi:hypothetical protein